MVEIRLSGQQPAFAKPADLTGMNLSQLQAAQAGAVAGINPGGGSPIGGWMSSHAANSAYVTSAGVRGSGGGAAFGTASGGSMTADIAAGFVRALSTPVPSAPIWSVVGDLNRQVTTFGRSPVGATIGFPGFGGFTTGGTGGGFGGGANGGFAIPTPPGGWIRPPPFLTRQGNQPVGGPPGGGGFGGGGRGGFGGHGGGSMPFAGMVGLGSTSRMLTRGLGIGMAADVAEELVFLPQSFGSMESSAVSSSAPARNLRAQLYAIARASHGSGQDLMNTFHTGVEPPAWMQRLGLSSPAAANLLSGFGIMQFGTNAKVDLVKGLAGTQFEPAFSGLDVNPSIGRAARYGMVQPNAAGVQTFTQQMAPILETAVERGMDRASVLRSIDAAVSMSARGGGIGASVGGLGSFIMRYSDLPGGRTGEAGLNVAERLQAATGTVGQNSLRTLAFVNAAQGMKSEGSLRNFLDKSQSGYFEKFTANPVGRQLVNNYLDAQKAGNDYAAAMYLAQIVGGGGVEGVGANPQAERDLLTNNPFVNQLPGYMRPLATGLTGLTPGQYIAGKNPPGSDLVTQAYDQLRRSGLNNAGAAATLANMTTESGGFNPYASNMSGGGRGAHGLLQLRGSRLSAFVAKYGHMPDDPNVSPAQLTREAVEFYRAEQTTPGMDSGAFQSGKDLAGVGSAESGVDILRNEYSRPGRVSQRYIDSQRAYARAYEQQYGGRSVGAPDANPTGMLAPGEPAIDNSSNIPYADLKGYATGMAGAMAASLISLKEMNTAIPALSHGADQAGKALNDVAEAARRLNSQIDRLNTNLSRPGTLGPGMIPPP